MGIFANENNISMFTVYGMAGCEPPSGLDEMVTFIREFTPPRVLAAIQGGEVIGEGARHRMPATRWRRYDKMKRWPTGLLVIGDAICSFNPIYAQGMTVATLEAKLLQHCLHEGAERLQRRYFRATTKVIGNAWQLATGGDLSIPDISGPRPASVRIVNRYVKSVQAAAQSDLTVARQLTRTIGLIDPPSKLLDLKVASRVASAGLKRRRSQL
jgi:2-polyprenyl-6-methoxyphenol hydroxylase-like FAD-dependent oxidoreductase